MKNKVLFVDDEANILDTFRVFLRKDFDVHIALSPEKALEKIQNEGPFPVVVSDLKMPGMDGIRFLAKVQEIAPDTVRVMLTGHADIESAIAAVNKGQVFRFLRKPCLREELVSTLQEAFRQYQLVTAEKELLHGTLRGSVKVLLDVLALVTPEAFGRSERIHRYALSIAEEMKLPGKWQLDLAAMLSQIGCVSFSEEVLLKAISGEELSSEEQKIFSTHPKVAARLLANIPRLDQVVEIILRQNDRLDEHPDMPIGSRILKIALDYDQLEQNGLLPYQAISTMKERQGWYDPELLTVFEIIVARLGDFVLRHAKVEELAEGMILAKDVITPSGARILVKGQELSETGILRLLSISNLRGIEEPLTVFALFGKKEN